MIIIRKMQARDREAVHQILLHTGMFTAGEVDVALELIDIYLTVKEQKDYFLYVAEAEGGEIVGYVCYGPTPVTEGTYDLYWIAVSPAYQGKGIGKQLLNFVEQIVQKQNGRLVVIETSSQEKYTSTQDFYLRNRFSLAARIENFYREGDDRLIYIKYLKSK